MANGTPATPAGSLPAFRRAIDFWHIWMVEFWGWLSGYALIKVARHANAADDLVTLYRVREIVSKGVEVGWSDDASDNGRLVPRRTQDEIVPAVQELIRRAQGA